MRDTREPCGAQEDRDAPVLDTRTPEQKAAGVTRMAAWLDGLGGPWRATFDRMKARRREEHALPLERRENEGGVS